MSERTLDGGEGMSEKKPIPDPTACTFCGETGGRLIVGPLLGRKPQTICGKCVNVCLDTLREKGAIKIKVFCPHCEEEALVANHDAARDWAIGHHARCLRGPMAALRAENEELRRLSGLSPTILPVVLEPGTIRAGGEG